METKEGVGAGPCEPMCNPLAWEPKPASLNQGLTDLVMKQIHHVKDTQELITSTFLGILEELRQAEFAMLQELIEHRVKAAIDVQSHPTVCVQALGTTDEYNRPEYGLGMLGVVNGILKKLTGETIAAVYDDNGALRGFKLL